MIRVALLALFAASQASALSCMRPDAVQLYETARDADASYLIVKGRLIPTGPIAIPEPDPSKIEELPPALSMIQLKGQILGKMGFFASFNEEITLSVECLSIWCGAPNTEREQIFALEKAAQGYVLSIGPCGGNAVPHDADQEERLLSCHHRNHCVRTEF